MIIAVIAFILLLVLGVPIAFVLGITGVIHLLTIPNSNLVEVITQRMFSGANNYTLLAIPFFVLAGELMNKSGITSKLLDFSRNLVGHLRGGLAYVNVLVGLFLGAILGSANAEAAIRSSIIVPEMEKDGFPRKFSAALTATSSVIGPIHPPSIVFIIYAVVASSSVGALFLAGIIPAFLIAISHFVIIYFYARNKKELKVRPFPSFRKLVFSFLQSLPALSIPLIILGGIYSGIFTPTESGAIACFVAIIIGLFYYKTLKLSHFPEILFNAGIITASVMIIIATANILGWTLTIEQMPQKIADALLTFSENPYIILLIINIFLLIVGMFMEVTAALLILVPVLLPVVTALGIDPTHFGLIVCLNLCIGFVTPPVGVVLFVTSNITKVRLPDLIRSSVPFIGALIIVLMIVTYFPEISLWLPKLAGLG